MDLLDVRRSGINRFRCLSQADRERGQEGLVIEKQKPPNGRDGSSSCLLRLNLFLFFSSSISRRSVCRKERRRSAEEESAQQRARWRFFVVAKWSSDCSGKRRD